MLDLNDQKTVIKSLIYLYYNQTQDERLRGATVFDNGVGFNSVDAPFMTQLGDQLVNKRRPLTSKQYTIVHECIQKYGGQLNRNNTAIDMMNLSPDVLVVLPSVEKPDGILRIRSGRLEFVPMIYPTTQIKNIGFKGDYIDGTEFVWYAPITTGNINSCVEMFKKSSITDQVQEVIKKDRLQKEELKKSLSDTTLFDFQKEGVPFLLSHHRCMLAFAPGLGKSATAIHAANMTGKNTLIVCPLTLTRNWKEEIKKWINEDSVIWRQFCGTPQKFMITNYDTITHKLPEFIALNFDNLIVDESVLVKNRKAVRSKAIKELSKDKLNVWLLSGSPMTKFYDDMWSQLSIIDSKRFSSYWRFANTYCVVESNQWGVRIVNNQIDSADRIKADLRDYYICRTYQDLEKSGELVIPEWVFNNVSIEMSKSQYTMYAQMEAEFLAILPDDDELLAPNILAQLTRLIQISSNPLLIGGNDDSNKWKAVSELLEFERTPAIIWTTFKATAKYIAYKMKDLKYRVAMLTGDTDVQTRNDIKNAFQEGKIDILVAHPAVGKFGLTLTAGKTAIYLERSYNFDDYYQSLYRIRRIGTTESPHVIHLLSCRPNGYTGATVDNVIDRIIEFRKNSSLALTSSEIRKAFRE